nr:MAG TPA: hypothetical protein [Caudoviricetes sp.]
MELMLITAGGSLHTRDINRYAWFFIRECG